MSSSRTRRSTWGAHGSLVRSLPVLGLVLVIAVGACVVNNVFLRSSEVGPRIVDVEFDAGLDTDDAMVLGSNQVVTEFGNTEQREVELKSLADGAFHLIVRGRGGLPEYRYRNVIELWIEFDSDADPQARADFHQGPVEAATLWPVLGLTGEVALGDSLRPGTRADAPAVLRYSITGDYGGSEATSSGKVRLR